MWGGLTRGKTLQRRWAAQYFNLYILATQDEGAGFGFEDDKLGDIDGDRAVGGVFYRIKLQIYVDGFAGIGGGIGEVVAVETDGVGGELYHRALPYDVGRDGGCADGNHGGEDMPVAEERDAVKTCTSTERGVA